MTGTRLVAGGHLVEGGTGLLQVPHGMPIDELRLPFEVKGYSGKAYSTTFELRGYAVGSYSARVGFAY